jgi:decaprenylphospho-beta-D-erythro-pentofuranosid-2-ulose 2-reductase
MRDHRPENVLILGATSAIAAEVTALHAARGDRLHLVGRDPAKLAAVAARCAAVTVTAEAADFGDPAVGAAVADRAVAALGHVDRVLIAHGVLGDQLASERDFAEAEAIFRVNLLSVVALLVPLANHLEARRAGRVGVITSVAGDRGRPRNYTYGAAKGALHVYLQGLRSRLYPAGVAVTTLKLGPVATPMTLDHPKNALFGQPAPVARGIVTAMDRRTPEAYVPAVWRAIMPLVAHTPERLFQWLPFLAGR